MKTVLRRCYGQMWRQAVYVAATVGALLPSSIAAHENAALAWVWSAVEADGNSTLVDFLDRNNGRIVDLLLEVPGTSGSGPAALYDACVTGGVENTPVTSLPLAAFEIPSDDAFECGDVTLRITGEDHVSRHESYYPTYLSEVIAGSFRVIRLEEWGDAASQKIVFVIEGMSR